MLNASAVFKIRAFSSDDLPAVLEIQNLCESVPAWGGHDYERLADDPRGMLLVAETEGHTPPELLGFAAAYRVGGEAELWNIAVMPRFRRQGVARTLLVEVCRNMANAGAQRLFLEVRKSNTPATEFYRSLGFVLLNTRKGYYQNPLEDALVLFRKLTPSDIPR